jgi:hypothetical protein
MNPRYVLDTKTYWLTGRQWEYDFEFDLNQVVFGSICDCNLISAIILLSTMFSNNLSLCSYFSVRDQFLSLIQNQM